MKFEEWIGELEKVMKLSIKEAIKDVLHSCPMEVSELLENHCGQAILNASRIIWTGDVEKCIEQGT